MCRLSPRDRSTACPGLASEPTTSTRRAPPSDGAANPKEGHQPPTTFHLGAATARVTSVPDVTTAIGTPFHDATAPVTTTGPAALTGLRLSRAVAAEGDAGTAPPKYNGLMTSASADGIPVAVKGAGVGTTVVVGAAGVFLATLGGAEEHPLKARAATKAVASPTERARPAGGREMGNMLLPYGVPTRVQRTRGRVR